jgi:muconolactone delta-isomerase
MTRKRKTVEARYTTLLLVAGLLLSLLAFGTAGEREEVLRLAPQYQAEVEVRMPDGTRADMVTATHAIEVDYAGKWQQGVTQSLHYSRHTGKQAMLVLLVSDLTSEVRQVERAAWLCGQLGIDLRLEKKSEP